MDSPNFLDLGNSPNPLIVRPEKLQFMEKW